MAPSLGAKIRKVREAKQMSPAELAAETGIDKSTILDYEKGNSEPTFTKLKTLAKALELRAGYFFDELPELQKLVPKAVAVFESLRLFFAKHGPPDNREHPYWKAVRAADDAPTTVKEWERYDRLEREIHGSG